MHGRLYNELVLDLTLQARSPLLIKAGGEGAAALDPTLPDMNFVRTRHATLGEVVYIPGSSLKGVIRAHTERLLRSIRLDAACNPLALGGRARAGMPGGLRPACSSALERQANGRQGRHAAEGDHSRQAPLPEAVHAYRESCFACRLFGNTRLAGRVRVEDFYPPKIPYSEVRHGVAIDRVSGGVVPGVLYQLEVVSEGSFRGSIRLRNFTAGQLGLLGAALLDMADGLVPLGSGKSRGFGRVQVSIESLMVRTMRNPDGQIPGVGALCDEGTRNLYQLRPDDGVPVGAQAERDGGFFVLQTAGKMAEDWLKEAAPLWVREVEG